MPEMTYKEPPWTLEELSVWAIRVCERLEELENAVAALQKGFATPPEPLEMAGLPEGFGAEKTTGLD